jgi:hypothetical protein
LLKPVCLGDLVVAAFDEAAFYSTDPREISRWATKKIARVLLGTRRTTAGRRSLSTDRAAVAAASHSPSDG